MKEVVVIGAGLSGCEAAYQIAKRGIPVTLVEMRGKVNTPIHKTNMPAELVCSNSLGTTNPEHPSGLLKEELYALDSIIMQAANHSRVPAGQALAVDRVKFSQYIHEKLSSMDNIKLIREEVKHIPTSSQTITIIATGPLTSHALAISIKKYLGENFLYFFDAVSPIVTAESINMDKVFFASRYDKGDADYINCPMNDEEYDRFYQELVNAERVPVKDFEKKYLFEGCMPIEEMADRGKDTLLFGPLKPVGLHPKAKAVVQLRKENLEQTLYSLVGFQTRLKWGEQKRVFRLIPGLEKAEFVRYGVMHKNIYINSPQVLKATLQLRKNPHILMAGQIVGVEGYLESTAMGVMAGINAFRLIIGEPPLIPPRESGIGSLIAYITNKNIHKFQPMNINFGIFPAVKAKSRKERRKKIIQKARETFIMWVENIHT